MQANTKTYPATDWDSFDGAVSGDITLAQPSRQIRCGGAGVLMAVPIQGGTSGAAKKLTFAAGETKNVQTQFIEATGTTVTDIEVLY